MLSLIFSKLPGSKTYPLRLFNIRISEKNNKRSAGVGPDFDEPVEFPENI